MNGEITVQVSVGGRPLWFKKKTIDGEMTARLTDRHYDQIVEAAQSELARLCRLAASGRALDEVGTPAAAAAPKTPPSGLSSVGKPRRK